MFQWPREGWIVGLGGAILLFLFLFLPSVDGGIYASPDETAVAVIAERLRNGEPAFFEEPLVRLIPWLHPRSWISVGERILPVGFLAWPWLLHLGGFLTAGRYVAVLASLMIVSGAIPWYLLIRSRWGWKWACFATAFLFLFPVYLLYGNRSLFANGVQLTGFFWVLWLLDRPSAFTSCWKRRCARFLTGSLIAFTCLVRPIEIVWILPWIIWFWMRRPFKREDWKWLLAGMIVILFPILWLVRGTYGSWFGVGYFFHDNVSPLFFSSLNGFSKQQASVPTYLDLILPYGFHPRNIWWNVTHFLVLFLWPWTLTFMGLLVLAVRQRLFVRMTGTRFSWTPFLLALWTTGFLLVIYGSGLYADHVRLGAVSMGNSFLRYLLPLVPLWAISVTWLLQRLRFIPWQKRVMAAYFFFLLGSGVYWTFAHDDEGLIFTRRELVRYTQIRVAVSNLVPERAMILSERSDKIFFPHLRSVSPLPPIGEVQMALSTVSIPSYLYVRPLSASQRDAWRAQGIETAELATFGRERLYRLTLFLR